MIYFLGSLIIISIPPFSPFFPLHFVGNKLSLLLSHTFSLPLYYYYFFCFYYIGVLCLGFLCSRSSHHNMDEWKRSGQIPEFGNWEHANDLPITQYFECARQAGLIRYSSSSGECGQHCIRGDHLYPTSDIRKLSGHNANLPPARKTRLREKRGPNVKEQRRQGKGKGKVYDVTEPPRKQQQQLKNQQRPIKNVSMSCDEDIAAKKGSVARPKPTVVRPPKPVDEDLYKIPPELLRSSKQKKFPGLFSCLVPACAS